MSRLWHGVSGESPAAGATVFGVLDTGSTGKENRQEIVGSVTKDTLAQDVVTEDLGPFPVSALVDTARATADRIFTLRCGHNDIRLGDLTGFIALMTSQGQQ